MCKWASLQASTAERSSAAGKVNVVPDKTHCQMEGAIIDRSSSKAGCIACATNVRTDTLLAGALHVSDGALSGVIAGRNAG
jgi:hypothetical protein